MPTGHMPSIGLMPVQNVLPAGGQRWEADVSMNWAPSSPSLAALTD